MSEASEEELLSTPLHAVHVQAGAKMVGFGGWSMPVWYTSLLEEHRAVREQVGLFDVSHMGEFWFEGPDATRAVDAMVSADVAAIPQGRAKYSMLLNEKGGILDDLLVYRFGPEKLLAVVNAGTRLGDWERMMSLIPDGAKVTARDATFESGLVALQGPASREVLRQLVQEGALRMPYYGFKEIQVAGMDCVVSRTGYTGEFGYEILCPWERTPELWNTLVQAGQPHGLLPAGLGARDTLRLEAGMMLSGSDIGPEITPLEAGLEWSIAWDSDFVGREALRQQKESGLSRRVVGLEMLERAIPRPGFPVLDVEGNPIGTVSSGTQGPTVQKAIGIACIDSAFAEPGTELLVSVRSRKKKAVVVALPFYQRPR